MTADSITAVSEKLRAILATENEMLQSGHAQNAASLIQEKMNAVHELEQIIELLNKHSLSSPQRREIEKVIQMAEVNSVHFEAIRNGVRRAINRLQGLNGNAYVGSYLHDGRKVLFPQAAGRYMTKS